MNAKGVHYCVWAPEKESIAVQVQTVDGASRTVGLARESGGYFAGLDPGGAAGDRYEFVLDARDKAPDPASRFQPDGVFGPSAVVDAQAYAWRTQDWARPGMRGRVIYEIHLGTFTPRGTFRSAIDRFDALVRLGVNTLQIMPVADFPGRCNWGYDGTMLFAPARCYGSPDDFRALIDAAHARGLAVVLDVVYNHIGADGNHLPRFSPRYFQDSGNAWGTHFNLDGGGAEAVRSFFTQNAAYWMDDFRMDGLRLDATHAIPDTSERHLVAELVEIVHQRGGFVILEDERNEIGLLGSDGSSGWNADAIWADDFHHSVRVALTHEKQSYYGSFAGTSAELADVLDHGWLFRGQHFPFWDRPRGSECRQAPPEYFILCISNHDQVGNRVLGERLNQYISAEAYRAVSVLVCLTPFTPMLFMGQEWASDSPFLYFSDVPPETGARRGEARREEFRRTGICTDESVLADMPDPQHEETFLRSKLDWQKCDQPPHRDVCSLYAECLALRRRERVLQNPPRDSWSTAAVTEAAIAIRWRDPKGDWLLVLAFRSGKIDGPLSDASWLWPATGRRWHLVLSSNDQRFGGDEASPLEIGGAPVDVAGPGAWLWHEVPSPDRGLNEAPATAVRDAP